jgi:hypothetical protein
MHEQVRSSWCNDGILFCRFWLWGPLSFNCAATHMFQESVSGPTLSQWITVGEQIIPDVQNRSSNDSPDSNRFLVIESSRVWISGAWHVGSHSLRSPWSVLRLHPSWLRAWRGLVELVGLDHVKPQIDLGVIKGPRWSKMAQGASRDFQRFCRRIFRSGLLVGQASWGIFLESDVLSDDATRHSISFNCTL